MSNLTILALIIAVITNIIAITTLIYAKSLDKKEEDHDKQSSHDLNSRNVILTIKDAVSGQIIVERNIEALDK